MLFTRQMSCFLAYDINWNKWHRVSVPNTPFLLNRLPLSTDSGLVCYRRHFVAHKRQQQEPIELLVCNPLTGSSRQLPSLHAKKIEVLGMVCGLEADGAAYRILLIHCCSHRSVPEWNKFILKHIDAIHCQSSHLDVSNRSFLHSLFFDMNMKTSLIK
jgi:hypothetical protein